MELHEATEKRMKTGADNPTFHSQEFVSIDCGDDRRMEEEADDTELKHNKRLLERKMEDLQQLLEKHRQNISRVFRALFLAGYLAMVIAACVLNFQRGMALLVLTLVASFFMVWDGMMRRYEGRLQDALHPLKNALRKQWFWIRWVVCVVLLGAVASWLVLDTAKQGTRPLVSFAGLLTFVLLMVIFSRSPFRVSWRAVLWGVGLQFLFGLLILRTRAGFTAVEWLGRQVEVFLAYTDDGSKFVFGDKFTDHFFAFKVLPIVVFFSTVISMLYYLGFMQWLILKVGFVMQITMGTSPTESMVAAGNIFVGQTESPLLIRPYISQLTVSEIHAVMTSGFATIAGSVLGAFISFGIQASHLLTASMMSAPASLAIAKTFWPETEIPRVTAKRGFKLEKGEGRNLLEAACHGASASISLVANIAVNLIAFLALLSFVNAALSWLGNMFDYPQLSFSLICSYVFMPFSFLMGVAWEDSFVVGELIGLKTFFNEFVAYERLADLIQRREAGGPEYVDNIKQYLSVHSETIATYALCGFANIGSLGVMIGGLSAMAPERRGDISRCAIRALVSGTVACFMTACVAGILYIPPFSCAAFLENEFSSSSVTNSTQLQTCCLDVYNGTSVISPFNVTVGGSYSLDILHNCCSVTAYNCSSILP
ncbi:solute carrier family 28 member 3-like [Megalops cyprinoides]|uniref:solute carrier family 28 member 3-like n=1 Tax=Megalops cyprinoides TaxID=118141 RepID=UPI00186521A4|nr:solute carrier family 28 member 3-like [Megalops cyprinoides]